MRGLPSHNGSVISPRFMAMHPRSRKVTLFRKKLFPQNYDCSETIFVMIRFAATIQTARLHKSASANLFIAENPHGQAVNLFKLPENI
jgi:hypothetical protein